MTGTPVSSPSLPSLSHLETTGERQSACERGLQRLQRLLDHQNGALRRILAVCLPYLTTALSEAAWPEHVAICFERLVQTVPDPVALCEYLAAHPRALEMLTTLFAGSQFLSEVLLRQPEDALRLLERHDENGLARREQVTAFQAEALAAADGANLETARDALRRYQHWQLLRIGAADLLALLDLAAVTAQLSRLADGLVRAALILAARRLGLSAPPEDEGPAGFVVLALGKLGGGEINYSSDIDLVFLAQRDHPPFLHLARLLIDVLSRPTAAGFLYRVDMRLRPWGRDGALVTTLDAYLEYLRRHARLWEKQALLKARPIAGDIALGEAFLERAQPFIFAVDPAMARRDIAAMKQRTEAYLRQQGRQWGEVKLGVGSIRDAEFVVQYLQLVHGGREPGIRSGRTLDALSRLFAAGLLSAADHRVLGTGYVFLRAVEHYLQLLHYRQTSTLPTAPAELEALARRLGFGGEQAAVSFLTRYEQHCAAIRRVYESFLGDDAMSTTSADRPTVMSSASPPSHLERHLERMDAAYATVFNPAEIRHHAELAAGLSEAEPVKVEAMPLDDDRWQVTIVGYDYLGELSLICGLLFVYGLDILSGHVFTYEPAVDTGLSARGVGRRSVRAVSDRRQKIVDVFTVRPVTPTAAAELSADGGRGFWQRYASELADLVRKLHFRRHDEVQGWLARRVAAVLAEREGIAPRPLPVDIRIDNESSERYSLLMISGIDTPGFLFELTNALALNGVYIARVEVNSTGNRVHDILYVTDTDGRPITSPQRQRELRAAIALVKHFTHLLPQSPNPELALIQFREFLAQLFRRPDWPDELVSLERPEVLEVLARLLGVSDFLWNDFLRMQYANLFPVVSNVAGLERPRSREELAADLQAQLALAPDPETRVQVLNAFKDREMFRIDMRHILGHTKQFGQFSGELTALMEVVVDAAYRLCEIGLVAQYGLPRLADGSPSPVSVLALGKAGGAELGFASDIELMFVYAGDGHTTGLERITTAEFYEKLVAAFLRTLRAKREGIFHVDLQLRPYGKAGSLAVSLEAFRRYFAPDGPAWAYERQALVKLRPIAGDAELGRRIMTLRDAFLYTGKPFDVVAMRAMRERQLRHLVTPGTFNAKFSPGGLVDVEYLVQALQITYGHAYPELRVPNTRQAMKALQTVGILATDDYERLFAAYNFLRNLINALRIVRGHAKDLTVPPTGSEELAFLARRLGYGADVDRLLADLTAHTVAVQAINRRLLDAMGGSG